MHTARLRRALRLFLLSAPFGLQSCEPGAAERSDAAPVVAGLATSGLDARARGLVLLGELGCVACHAQGSEGARIDTRSGPDLVAVGNRIRLEYLPHFLADPIGVEPGTTMPDLLRDRDGAARAEAAGALVEYLRSFGEAASAPEARDDAAAARGAQLFHEIGCAACHAPLTVAAHAASSRSSPIRSSCARSSRTSDCPPSLHAPHRPARANSSTSPEPPAPSRRRARSSPATRASE
jgi:mono/diheme cytochrome c family protein